MCSYAFMRVASCSSFSYRVRRVVALRLRRRERGDVLTYKKCATVQFVGSHQLSHLTRRGTSSEIQVTTGDDLRVQQKSTTVELYIILVRRFFTFFFQFGATFLPRVSRQIVDVRWIYDNFLIRVAKWDVSRGCMFPYISFRLGREPSEKENDERRISTVYNSLKGTYGRSSLSGPIFGTVHVKCGQSPPFLSSAWLELEPTDSSSTA